MRVPGRRTRRVGRDDANGRLAGLRNGQAARARLGRRGRFGPGGLLSLGRRDQLERLVGGLAVHRGEQQGQAQQGASKGGVHRGFLLAVIQAMAHFLLPGAAWAANLNARWPLKPLAAGAAMIPSDTGLTGLPFALRAPG
jgi:hypothetical protein